MQSTHSAQVPRTSRWPSPVCLFMPHAEDGGAPSHLAAWPGQLHFYNARALPALLNKPRAEGAPG